MGHAGARVSREGTPSVGCFYHFPCPRTTCACPIAGRHIPEASAPRVTSEKGFGWVHRKGRSMSKLVGEIQGCFWEQDFPV